MVVVVVVVVVTVHCILRQVKDTVVRSSNWILPSCQPRRVDHLRPKQETVNNNNKNKQTTTKTTTRNKNNKTHTKTTKATTIA